jgi:hypothetical protein
MIGQLYPILLAKDGEIIDGMHREKANRHWKRLRLNHIDTEEKKLQARLIANFHRRIVPYSEKKEWINKIARMYEKQGEKSIAKRISKSAGIRYMTVISYLDDKYKRHVHESAPYKPEIAPSEQLITMVGTHRGSISEAQDLVERHREEVIEKEKPHIVEEVKKQLVGDPMFQKEVLRELQRPKYIEPSEKCPSGVCELPNVIDGVPAVDVVAERLEQFWENNPFCTCRKCRHYEVCGVIR